MVVLAGYVAALGYAMTKPPAPAVTQDLAGWLKAHGLTYGLSHYGLANVTTMASGAAVAVRPVVAEHARIAPDRTNTTSPGTTREPMTRPSSCCWPSPTRWTR